MWNSRTFKKDINELDVEKLSFEAIIQQLELKYGKDLKKQEKVIKNLIFTRKQNRRSKTTLKLEKKRGGELSSDEADSDSSDSDNSSEETEEETEKATQPTIKRNKLSINNEYVYLPRTRFRHLLGNCATIVDEKRSPGFIGVNPSSQIIIYAEGKSIILLPLKKSIGGSNRVNRKTMIRKDINDTIFQLSQLSHPSGSWFASRIEYDINLLGFNEQENNWECRQLNINNKKEQQTSGPLPDFLKHISPSPHDPGLIAVLHEKKLREWNILNETHDEILCHSNQKLIKCSYGAHPAEILISTSSELYQVDSRTRTVANIANFSKSFYPGHLLVFDRVPNRRFEIIAVTDFETSILDVRVPGKMLVRERHVQKFKQDDPVEMAFDPAGSKAFVWTTKENPKYCLVNQIPSAYHPLCSTDLSFSRPINIFDEVQVQESSLFQVRIPPPVSYHKKGVTYIHQHDHDNNTIFKHEAEVASILGVGFTSAEKGQNVAVICSTNSHQERLSEFYSNMKPALILKELET